ncbi:efflux RND transporter permease subunit [Rhodohalobacter sulfatireducens]|uniref:Efflux RND transporter permease subunit n=1 Tax=Rhodohalobacter sulfatireducens TaxID=2911366 RepID=A0ABS9KCI3_9BACT|nr:efflux RND transporter permease subunit [Rhodohalobacter sulfatireducens]MCG2588543.1 efflux RND transporter permease subunit [Rhodohalobacter sulfatireducens]
MKTGFAGKIAQAFIDSKLTLLLMVAFLAIGIYGVWLTPSEEEPQIDVPMADIFVGYPGASPQEVENRISIPLEKILSNISGVEYVYSTSMPEMAMVSARFYVGQDVEESLVRLYNEIMKFMDTKPEPVTMPLIKTRSINDVPIVTLTLWSDFHDDYEIRRIAQELDNEIKSITDVAETKIHGGRSRTLQVVLDKEKMASLSIDPLRVAQTIQAANREFKSGSFTVNDEEYLVQTGSFLKSAEDVGSLVLDVRGGDSILLRDVADIQDGPGEPVNYVSYSPGPVSAEQSGLQPGNSYSAVTISVAKRQGADAMTIATDIDKMVEKLNGSVISENIHVETTRNYGETATEKVNTLLIHLIVAVLSVSFVVFLAMGWRGALVVFISVPITFALTLFFYFMYDYTLNRITLFALVFVTGIVVDNSIIVAENMHRHFKMRNLPLKQAAIYAINEVGNPAILATFTVIAAVIPMAFVSGLMGPYMSPIAIGATVAMLLSLIISLIVTPWLGYRLLSAVRVHSGGSSGKRYKLEDTMIFKLYEKTMRPLMESTWKRWTFLIGTTVILLASLVLFYTRAVEVKMLPFDNKNEVQLIIDMPEGTTLERTDAVAREVGLVLLDIPEVYDYQVYSGTNAPINFNGLVRSYDMRQMSNVADIQVNLVDKSLRSDQSHDIAKRMRPLVQKVGEKYGANVKVVEVPPGPPVLSTLVAEVYGPNLDMQRSVGEDIKTIFSETPGIVDTDWMVEADQTEYRFAVQREKAALTGVMPQQVTESLGMILGQHPVSSLYDENEASLVPIQMKLPEASRAGVQRLGGLHVQSQMGSMVPVTDLVTEEERTLEKSIHRKNQRRVVYVTAEVAGEIESPVYAILDAQDQIDGINLPSNYTLEQQYAGQPFTSEDVTVKWDGEWQITLEVFRDLGIAFAVVLLIIYILIVGWFQDFGVPFIMMIAIPLSLIGILIGHWLTGAFFTATSMIGMIALAGIMVRNSVLLIDFIKISLKEGNNLQDAVIEAGAVRTMPILLTAGTVVIGAIVILFDPIFQGLAISLMGGAIASTALTLITVPLIYFMVKKNKSTSDIITN